MPEPAKLLEQAREHVKKDDPGYAAESTVERLEIEGLWQQTKLQAFKVKIRGGGYLLLHHAGRFEILDDYQIGYRLNSTIVHDGALYCSYWLDNGPSRRDARGRSFF